MLRIALPAQPFHRLADEKLQQFVVPAPEFGHLRRKFRALDNAPAVTMEVLTDASEIADEIFSLHLHTWLFLVIMVGNGYLKLASLGPSWLDNVLGWALSL